jgi:hypothetical protein
VYAVALCLICATAALSGAVDIFNSVTQTWSTSQLSVPRFHLAAASAGSFAIFAGGKPTPNAAGLLF